MAIGWHDVRREPYRLLFPLGTAFGCLGVSHWLLYATGVSRSASGSFHASIQIGAYLYCFIAGFLWTAMPRMAGAPPASSAELLTVLSLLGAQAGLLALGRGVLAQLCFAGLLASLLAFAARRLWRGARSWTRTPAGARAGPPAGPTEFVWVPIGAGFGLVGSALLALGGGASAWMPAWVLAAGRVMAQQGFTLSVVVGVAGFMAPRLMGHASALVQPGLTEAQMREARQRRTAGHLLAAGALGASFFVEGAGFIRAAYVLRAAVATLELGRGARLWKLPAVTDFYVRLLWLSLWLVLGGLWAVAVAPRYRIALLHLLLIGGFSLMIFAVGTMVVLSHAGQPEVLRKPLWVLRLVAAGVIGATVARVAADLWPARYFGLLGTAASLWLAAALGWLVFAIPNVLRPVSQGTFERVHEQQKQRLHAGQSGPAARAC